MNMGDGNFVFMPKGSTVNRTHKKIDFVYYSRETTLIINMTTLSSNYKSRRGANLTLKVGFLLVGFL